MSSPPNLGQPSSEVVAPPRNNIKLAHDPSTGEYKRPPTVGGIVNIGGLASIELPGLDEQKAGFYLPEEQRELLLIQYPRTYVALVAKPDVVAVPVPPTPPRLPGETGGQQPGGGESLNAGGAGEGQSPLNPPQPGEGQS